MNKIEVMNTTAVIITKNEEDNIARCLSSLKWADEIIVIDDASDDRTVEIAKECGAIVYQFSGGYAAAKNYGISKASNTWIFSIDADELVTDELTREISSALKGAGTVNGFWVPRKNHIGGRWIRYAGYYPDLQLRLFRKDAGRFMKVAVHERVELDGEAGIFSAPIIHYTYQDISAYFDKVHLYARLDGEQALANGVRVSWLHLILSPIRQFVGSLMLERGWREGLLGLRLAWGMSIYGLIKNKTILYASKQGATSK